MIFNVILASFLNGNDQTTLIISNINKQANIISINRVTIK